MSNPPIVPSSWLLTQMIARAEAACDNDIEQTRLRDEARKDARAESYALAQARAGERRRRDVYWFGR